MQLSAQNKKYLKLLPPFYFLVLAAAVTVMDIVNPRDFKIIDLVFIIIFSVPFILRIKMVYVVGGIIYTLLWGYMLLAVTMRFAAYLNGTYFQNPLRFFGFGFALSFISFMFSFVLIILGFVIGEGKGTH